MPELRPALFLDRDGVINVDRGYVYRREAFEWLPGIFDLARMARHNGLAIVVVTNQSGIGRGYYTEPDFLALTAYMQQRFAAENAPVARVYHCPFHPEAEQAHYRHPDHPWRKPHPGMIFAARDDLGIDLAASIMLGDRRSDLEAGANAGVGTLAQIGRLDISRKGLPPFARFDTPAEAARWLETISTSAVNS
jgi:D-glycero-D-manno-heptose 1,7-bisphosphate phosphatase